MSKQLRWGCGSEALACGQPSRVLCWRSQPAAAPSFQPSAVQRPAAGQLAGAAHAPSLCRRHGGIWHQLGAVGHGVWHTAAAAQREVPLVVPATMLLVRQGQASGTKSAYCSMCKSQLSWRHGELTACKRGAPGAWGLCKLLGRENGNTLFLSVAMPPAAAACRQLVLLARH